MWLVATILDSTALEVYTTRVCGDNSSVFAEKCLYFVLLNYWIVVCFFLSTLHILFLCLSNSVAAIKYAVKLVLFVNNQSQAWLLLSLPLMFYHLSRCVFISIYFAFGLILLPKSETSVFHGFWKILSHNLFKYYLSLYFIILKFFSVIC